MHYWFNGWHMFWMTISWIAGIGLFLLLLLMVGFMVSAPQSNSDAEDILRRRYAAGEIDTQEYERRLEELHKTKLVA
jgi:uncharacterized membrane protein